jgi:hypothetical protein
VRAADLENKLVKAGERDPAAERDRDAQGVSVAW